MRINIPEYGDVDVYHINYKMPLKELAKEIKKISIQKLKNNGKIDLFAFEYGKEIYLVFAAPPESILSIFRQANVCIVVKLSNSLSVSCIPLTEINSSITICVSK